MLFAAAKTDSAGQCTQCSGLSWVSVAVYCNFISLHSFFCIAVKAKNVLGEGSVDLQKILSTETAETDKSNLELSVLLLELLVFVRVAVWKLVYLDAILLDLLADLQTKKTQG